MDITKEDNLDKAISDMKELSKVNSYEVVEDILYMTFTSVYGEYWIDLQLHSRLLIKQ
ncbi:hypothetical protein ACFKI6_05595 [Streptococcus agalactiae]|nr:hypothetical protein [Streptococcus agalactiae]AKI57419.1 Hypothetical Protein GBS85147_0991 [Streptococcus agalactiae]EPU00562.1 hypothetical protein SAG0109_07585 [Streptococcus agalactiae BSU108]EPW72698.1 hypothetical protein SAG0101_03145 [Streptococcus agalactiae BSU451]EPW91292.1 hypothetical protein SAG0141_00205 [Streptococcus agalactiae MRI Z1-023]ODG95338.1 hypothetical protein TH70_0143 [Streptococcus agalactiae]